MRKALSLLLVASMMLVFAAEFALADTVKIAMLPKFKGENYFDACKIGAQEAIDELNKDEHIVDFLYDGPPQDQATNQKQVDILEGWIAPERQRHHRVPQRSGRHRPDAEEGAGQGHPCVDVRRGRAGRRA